METPPTELPADAHYVRTTPRLTAETTPAGLLRSHRVAEGAWAVVRVLTGTVHFAFEDATEQGTFELTAGAQLVVPPGRPHHVEPVPGCEFEIDFHRVGAPE